MVAVIGMVEVDMEVGNWVDWLSIRLVSIGNWVLVRTGSWDTVSIGNWDTASIGSWDTASNIDRSDLGSNTASWDPVNSTASWDLGLSLMVPG